MKTVYRKTLPFVLAMLAIVFGIATGASASPVLLFSGTSTSSLDMGTVSLDLYSDADGYLGVVTWDNSTLTATNLSYITAASLKITSDSLTGTGSTLNSAPIGSTWSFLADSNAANVCGGSQNGGACATYVSGSTADVTGGSYTWIFDLDGALTLLPSSQFSAQIDFAKSTGRGNANLGTNFSAAADPLLSTVPEPATMTLIGSGLVGIATAVRRRRKARG